jgi:hypothetical protein
MKAGRLILICGRLEVLRSRGMVHEVLVLPSSGRVAITAGQLHADRNSQHIAAEQWQPYGYE